MLAVGLDEGKPRYKHHLGKSNSINLPRVNRRNYEVRTGTDRSIII